MSNDPTYDFVGLATAYNVPCDDDVNRIILPGAFKGQHNQKVPLIWRHTGKEIDNVVGVVTLIHSPEGIRAKGKFNSTKSGKKAKILVHEENIDSLSVYANHLTRKGDSVVDGIIREVSLVLAGANPKAKIYEVVRHSSDFDSVEDEYDDSGCNIFIPSKIEIVTQTSIARHEQETEEDLIHEQTDSEVIHEDSETISDILKSLTEEQQLLFGSVLGLATGTLEYSSDSTDDDNSIGQLYETLSEKQKDVLHYMVGEVTSSDSLQQELESEETTIMSNIFEPTNTQPPTGNVMSHELRKKADRLYADALSAKPKSLRQFALEHAGTYGIDNLDLLMPDSPTLMDSNGGPMLLRRDDMWVRAVLSGINNTPLLKLKTLYVDLTPAEARAKGYVTGTEKKEQILEAFGRETLPQTIYVKQKLDQDDIADLDLDIANWMNSEMNVMLDEEKARAILVGDGRELDDEFKIKPDKVRPIWQDNNIYSHLITMASTSNLIEFIDEVTRSHKHYRGSGNPILFIGKTLLSELLTIRNVNQMRVYEDAESLAKAMRVRAIVEVEIMDTLSRPGETTMQELLAIMVNLDDYRTTTRERGKKTFRTQFDIDYNQEKYLLETRFGGALVRPKAAVVFEKNTTTPIPVEEP